MFYPLGGGCLVFCGALGVKKYGSVVFLVF